MLGKSSYVLEMALKYDCSVLIMEKHAQERVQKTLIKITSDLLITCSFPIILRKSILEIPELGGINIHPSLLPRFRGPYPVFLVLLHEEEYTAVSIHRLSQKIDEGDILLRQEIKNRQV
jgi:methionyl-tRNA formyltransferase